MTFLSLKMVKRIFSYFLQLQNVYNAHIKYVFKMA